MIKEREKLSLLGSTGSIGTQALRVAEKLSIPVVAVAAHSNIKLLEEQIRKFKPEVAVAVDEKAAAELKTAVADTDTKVLTGMDGLIEAASLASAEVVLNSVVGMVGLCPTLAAVESGKKLALANKETLVAGGALVMDAARKNGIDILPVDSEHSAIFQCLQGKPTNGGLKKILLTASGGPFFGKKKEELKGMTAAEALKHPNWSMGSKITIDSATLMNKGLEVIEAAWLFGVSLDKIEVVVHRESIIHSAVEFEDNSVIAQLGLPDMTIPIQYALTYPERYPSPAGELDLFKLGRMTFFEPDMETFSCLSACKKAFSLGGTACAAANGANEAAVELFLKGEIGFLRIGELVEGALSLYKPGAYTLSDILETDKAAKEYVYAAAKK